jgi:hypothetical protein
MLRFFAKAGEITAAQEALDFLAAGGMARKHVASVLFWYTDPDSAYLQDRITKLAKTHVPMLGAIQRELWDCHRSLAQSDEDRMTAPSPWPVDVIDEVAEEMLEASAMAGNLADKLRAFTSAKGKLRNEEVIVSLCLEVQALTGKPHWTDIAYLLEAAWRTRGRREVWNEDRLRKLFNRYRESYPRAFIALKERAAAMKGEAHPKPEAKMSRSTRNRRKAEPRAKIKREFWTEPKTKVVRG